MILLLGKTKLDTMKVLISNVSGENNGVKEKMENPETSVEYVI